MNRIATPSKPRVVEPLVIKKEVQLSARMQCMEIWGGNRAIEKHFDAPGLDIFVYSAPYRNSNTGGGDIYYLTSCASGRISRFLLADVSGHGEAASRVAVSLRDLMRQNVNKISQEEFVSKMNQEFGGVARDSAFATAAVATFFEPTKTLSVSVAGHPYPMYYRARIKKWVYLDPARNAGGLENLPLGVHEDSNYPGRKIKTETGDMFLLYSDAFPESINQNGQQIGIGGVLDILNELREPDSSEIISHLRETMTAMSKGNLLDDDATLILGHFTTSKVRLRDNLMAPFRLLRSVSDNTRLAK
jgi:phosphoserine phosphatase RsbU/P